MRAACIAIALSIAACSCSRTHLPPPIHATARSGEAVQNDAHEHQAHRAVAGEAEPLAAKPAPAFPTQVRIERRGMTCRAATRAARNALKRMSYSIDSVTTPSPGNAGEIRAVRNTGSNTGDLGDSYAVAVRITCSDSGSIFEAATEEPLFGRVAFTRDLASEIDRAAGRRTSRPQAKTAQPAADLQVEVRPLTGRDASKQIGAVPETVGIMPVHIRITNRSKLTYRFAGARLRMMTEERVRQQPLPIDQVAAALAPEWADNARRQLLTDGEIRPGSTVEGYLFVPHAAYRRAKVVLIETESEEAEGFSVEF